MNMSTQLTGRLAMSLIASVLCAMPVKAQQGGDSFAHSTIPTPKKASITFKEDKPVQGALAICSPRTPVVNWFEKMHDLEYTLGATEGDRASLDKPLNQQAERVQIWSQTANKVAKNYRLLATTLTSMEVPAPDLKQYRDLKADWYKDTASIYEDMTRPRKPAKTVEELQAQVSDIKKRADSLQSERRELYEMDVALRKTHSVHLALQGDALQQYVKGKVPKR